MLMQDEGMPMAAPPTCRLVRRRRRWAAALAAAAATGGLAVLSIRTHQDSREVDSLGLFLIGTIVFVVPFSVAVRYVIGNGRVNVIAATSVSAAASAFIATRPPGNLMLFWFLYVLPGSILMLAAIDHVIRAWSDWLRARRR